MAARAAVTRDPYQAVAVLAGRQDGRTGAGRRTPTRPRPSPDGRAGHRLRPERRSPARSRRPRPCRRVPAAVVRSARSRSRDRRLLHRSASSAVTGPMGSWSVELPCSNVPAGGHLEQVGRPRAVLLAQHLDQLLAGPDVGQALHPVGVGIEGGGEAALRPCAGRAAGTRAVSSTTRRASGSSRRAPPVQVGAEQQSVVVQHLLEVRDDPVRVDGVAGEAARELVVDPAPGHRLEGCRRHRQRGRVTCPGVVAQQPLEDHRRRELGRASETASRPVEACGPAVGPRRRGRPRSGGLVPAAVVSARSARASVMRAAACSASSLRSAQVAEIAVQELGERRRPVTRGGREVGARVERLAVRREEGRHRPATVAGHGLDVVHVDRVDVGTLLTVDLHVDERARSSARLSPRPRRTRAP